MSAPKAMARTAQGGECNGVMVECAGSKAESGPARAGANRIFLREQRERPRPQKEAPDRAQLVNSWAEER
jgi:hypothetical protein